MITRKELKTKWKQLIDEPLDEEESVSVLYENNWVRIFVIKTTEMPKKTRIEVEVSLPQEAILTPEDLAGSELRNFVQSLIRHLEYLLRLADEGLTLGVMTREGIYTACLEVKDTPSDILLDILLPPKL
ncbi:MAG: hypothetical protein ACW98U_06745 [Candidatus Thorarchaeota archaeon]|jgi:hypothetical protein